jgi:hypothetical protein
MTIAGILAVYAALFVFVAVLWLTPGWWLSQHLFSQWGPRTDVPCMTRRELLGEGMRFVLLGGLMLGVTITIDAVAGDDGFLEHPSLGALFLIAAILMLMGIAGGCYLLIRGLFRSPRYVPPPQCERTHPPGPVGEEGFRAR